MQPSESYRLLDLGGGARLEWFGDRIVDRPHPAALGSRSDPDAWLQADLRFDRERGWTGPVANGGSWSIRVGSLDLELRPTEAGQVGLFPEQLALVPWLADAVARQLSAEHEPGGSPPAVLNLFAYTGLATLVLAEAGAAVTHVDSSRPAVAWARTNAERSGLADRPIRWIVDDARAFTAREARRGRRYAGLVLDPPSYGHGDSRQSWRIDQDLAPLLAQAVQLLLPGGFILLTAHSPGFDDERLADELTRSIAARADTSRESATDVRSWPGDLEHGDLVVATEDGRRLELGAFARRAPGA